VERHDSLNLNGILYQIKRSQLTISGNTPIIMFMPWNSR